MDKREPMTAEEQERIYQNALLLIEGELYGEAADQFARVPDYKDAARWKLVCEEKRETARLDKLYEEADKAAANRNVRSQEKAIRLFQRIRGYRDADERIEAARRAIEEIQEQEQVDRQEAIRAARADQQAAEARRMRRIRAALIGAACVGVCLLGVVLYRTVVAPALSYRKAVQMIENRAYDEAYRLLHKLNFMDSGDQVYKLAQDRLSEAEVGSVVQFGFYPQGSKASEDRDLIEWIVLDTDGSKRLLISKYALDCLPYQSGDVSQVYGSWETSLLRRWLNDTFLNEAFDPAEARLLLRTDMGGDETGKDRVVGADRVFVLNVAGAERYFPTDESRQCLPTRYAIGRGAYQSSIGRTCFWWLRTTVDHTEQTLEGNPTENITRAVLVGSSGKILEIGHYMFNRQYSVRPVIWVDTEPSAAVLSAEAR